MLLDSKEDSELNSESSFESSNTYDSMMKVKSISLNSKSKDFISLDISNFIASLQSSTNATKAEVSSKSSFSDLNVTSNILDIGISDASYDISLVDVDKDSLEELRLLLRKSRTNNSMDLLSTIKDSIIDIFGKGLTLNIKDISINNINLNGDNLDGFKIESKLNFKEDKNLSQKINYAPLFIAQNLDVDFKFRISEKLYSKLAYIQPVILFTNNYAIKKNGELHFDFTLNETGFKVNGKALQK